MLNSKDYSDWKRGPFAVFYNIYIPGSDNAMEIDAAIDIVREQINQVSASPAAHPNLTVYYNILNNFHALNETSMQDLCFQASSGRVNCVLMKQLESGSETVTLERLKDFCEKHPNHRVAYLHTKGSYHASEKNTNWRRLLTAAAMSPECVNPPNSTCNLCGLQFFTQFTFFIPGNIFTAHCGYVQKLLPLREFHVKHEIAVKKILLLRVRNQLKSSLLWDQRDFFGLDRYSEEHWIGSHPDVWPCDTDPQGNLSNVFQGVLQQSDFRWSMGPRNMGICGGINDDLQEKVRANPHLSRRETLFLPGLLVKWFELYGRAPNSMSWIWEFFPDGVFWKSGVRKHGADVVERLTESYYVSLDGSRLRSAFAPDARENISFGYHGSTQSHGSKQDGVAVFYHIAIPNEKDGSKIENQVEMRKIKNLVQQQLHIIRQSFAASNSAEPCTVFYTIAGSSLSKLESDSMSQLFSETCSSSPSLKCIKIAQFERNYEGETLGHMFRFCQENPMFRVSYLHNQAPMQLRSSQDSDILIRHMTKAATSELCLRALQQDDSCNVCGLIFYFLWTLFFPGNMFAATCKYVAGLVSPWQYEKSMIEHVGASLVERLRSKFTATLFPDRVDYLGLDRYATGHWIGSHPSIKPCDLSNHSEQLHHWGEQVRPDTDFSLMTMPHQRGAPFDMRWSKREIVWNAESFRTREFFLLAGHLFKWYSLYQKSPSPHSWIWWTFPDGLLWLKRDHQFGVKVIDEVTEKYAKDDL
jgi:hypothetical protein